MSRIIFIVLTLSAATFAAHGQLTPAQAQEQLLERAKLREKQREQMVEIKAGELEDMRAELIKLRAEVKTLRESASTKPAAGPRRVRTEIEVGMTRQELDTFVRSRNLRQTQQSTSLVGGVKQENLHFARVVSGSRQTGTRKNALGQDVPIYESTESTQGNIRVTLVDGIVTAVEAR